MVPSRADFPEKIEIRKKYETSTRPFFGKNTKASWATLVGRIRCSMPGNTKPNDFFKQKKSHSPLRFNKNAALVSIVSLAILIFFLARLNSVLHRLLLNSIARDQVTGKTSLVFLFDCLCSTAFPPNDPFVRFFTGLKFATQSMRGSYSQLTNYISLADRIENWPI